MVGLILSQTFVNEVNRGCYQTTFAALKEAFDPEESAQNDYTKSKSAVSVRSTTDVAMEKIERKKNGGIGDVWLVVGEHLLEWFTNDSGLGFGACDDSLPLPNKNEAEKEVDDILNSLRGLGLN